MSNKKPKESKPENEKVQVSTQEITHPNAKKIIQVSETQIIISF